MRVAVTHLEAFRLFRTQDWMTFDELMAQLTGYEKFDPLMATIGDAFHEALRRVDVGEHARLTAKRWRFNLSKVDGELALYSLRELRASKTYAVDGTEVEVRGRVDGADGIAIEDHKMKFGTFDAERYADSVQWKLYLDMLGGQMFRYNVFEGPDRDSAGMRDIRKAWELCSCPEYVQQHTVDCALFPDDCACALGTICKACGASFFMHGAIDVDVRALHILPLYAYPTLRDDVIEVISDYVAFARQHLTEAAILAWKAEQNRLHAHNDPGK